MLLEKILFHCFMIVRVAHGKLSIEINLLQLLLSVTQY